MSRPLPKLAPGEVMPPERILVAPSAMPVWRATRGPDQVFAWPQLYAIDDHGLDRETCEYIIVRSVTTWREWWAGDRPQPVYVLPCPVISRSDDGRRVLVIAPSGEKKWVNADGSIRARHTRPEREPKGYFRRRR